jgi:hypothetical protein
MSDEAKKDARPRRLALWMIFWAVAFYVCLAPSGWRVSEPWHILFLFIGALSGLAIEAISRPAENFRMTIVCVLCGAVLGITVEWFDINRISEARAVPGMKGEIDQSLILIDKNEVLDDFLRRLIFLPTAALLGGVAGFRILRYQPECESTSEPATEPRSSRVAVCLFGVMSGVACGIVGSLLCGYVAPGIELQAFAKVLAKSDLDGIPSLVAGAGLLFGACFGWLFGWLLTAFLRRKRMKTGSDYLLIWVFGLLPIAAVLALAIIDPSTFRSTPRF